MRLSKVAISILCPVYLKMGGGYPSAPLFLLSGLTSPVLPQNTLQGCHATPGSDVSHPRKHTRRDSNKGANKGAGGITAPFYYELSGTGPDHQTAVQP